MDKLAKKEAEIKAFPSQAQFRTWLTKNHARQEGVWVRFYKKDSGVKTIVYKEALDEALCFGWIDSIMKKYDDVSYIQKFSPRRPRSIWSKRNIEHIERLTKENRMMPQGLLQYETAKQDGRLDRAYEPPSKAVIPDDLLKLLSKDKKALAFAASLSRSNINAIAFRLSTAKKPETRERRLKLIVEMLKKGEMFH